MIRNLLLLLLLLTRFSVDAQHSIRLKEIVVTSRKIHNDTTFIDLSGKNPGRTVMISDFFSHQEGFHRDAKGQLFYKGKPVTDIAVDNGSFFNGGNIDIFQYLPMLALSGVEVVEMAIDSVTNTILPRPVVRVNLQLKEKYKKGRFGYAHAGGGTQGRYLANANLYSYNNAKQLSLQLNANNISLKENNVPEPRVSFSADGNDVNSNAVRLIYHNRYGNKVELQTSALAVRETKKYQSDILRLDGTPGNSYHTINNASSRILSIKEAIARIKCDIDKHNALQLNLSFDHAQTALKDTIRYDIMSGGRQQYAAIRKLSDHHQTNISIKLSYKKKFSSRKGRSINFETGWDNRDLKVVEWNDVYNTLQVPDYYQLGRDLLASERTLTLYADFTEPLNRYVYLKVYLRHVSNRMISTGSVTGDTLKFAGVNLLPSFSGYTEPGISFRKTGRYLQVDGILAGVAHQRDIFSGSVKSKTRQVSPQADFRWEYNINPTHSVLGNYTIRNNFPVLAQRTNINNSEDIISQTGGNVNLGPELRHRLELQYEVKKSDSLRFSFTWAAEQYNSKIGYRISDKEGGGQQLLPDNIGSSRGADAVFSLSSYHYNNSYVNFRTNINYQETPLIITGERKINSNTTITSVLATAADAFRQNVSFNPVFSVSYSRYTFETSVSRVVQLSYSDRISVSKMGFRLNLFPLLSYTAGVQETVSFSTNLEIRKNLFHNYGAAWFQVYDLFNSFRYTDGFASPSFLQFVQYAQLRRYMMVGLSLKFNNIR